VQTLFIVVLELDGGSRVVLDANERFVAQRLATPKDVYPALSNVIADFTAMRQAEAVIALQTQLARQLASQSPPESPVSP
jgi:hypothetical protein